MANSFAYSGFADGFIRGYSFVDDIKRKNRQEKRLEEQLAEQTRLRNAREDRAVAAERRVGELHRLALQDRLREIRRQNEADSRQALEDQRRREREDITTEDYQEDRDYELEQRQLQQQQRQMKLEGTALFNKGTATDEELAPYYLYVPEIQQHFQRKRRNAELSEALQGRIDMYEKQRQQDERAAAEAASEAAQQPGSIDGEATQQTDLVDPYGQVGIDGTYLQGSQGTGGLNSMDMSTQVDVFDPSLAQNEPGFMQKLANRATATPQAAAGALYRATGLDLPVPGLYGTPASSPYVQGRSVRETGENLYLPEGYMSPAQIGELPAAQQAAATQKNIEILEEVKARGFEAGATTPYAALLKGSQAGLAAAREQERLVEERYSGFIDATQGKNDNDPLFNLAEEDPLAFAMQYFRDRSTVRDAMGERGQRAMDSAAQPYLAAAESQLRATIIDGGPGSQEQRLATRRLAGVQATQKQIYEDYVPTKAINLRDKVPAGNETIINNVMDEVANPERPMGRPDPSRTKAALNTASRIINSDRPKINFSRKQIDHLITLVDAKLMSPGDLEVTMRTGRLPEPHPVLHGIEKVKNEATGKTDVWASYVMPDNSVQMMPVAQIGGGKKQTLLDYSVKDNLLGKEGIDQILEGYQMQRPTATQEELDMLRKGLIQNRSWVESRTIDLQNANDMMNLGMTFADAHALAEKEDHPAVWNAIEPDTPDMWDLMRSPAMASRMASENHHWFQWVPFATWGDRVRKGVPSFGIPASRNKNFDVVRMRADIYSRPESQEWPMGLDAELAAGNLQTDAELDKWLTIYYYNTDPEFRAKIDKQLASQDPDRIFDEQGNLLQNIETYGR